MEFRLTITLGSDAMQTYADLRKALRYIAKYTKDYRGPHEKFELNDTAQVRDGNGHDCGQWEITDADERAARINRALDYCAQQRCKDEHANENDDGPYFCKGCGREESICSADPCPAVIEDRNS